MRIRIAVGFALAFVVALLTVSPADAAVTTTVKSNGDIVINGDASPNRVQVVLCGGYAEITVDDDDPMPPIPVVDDIVINLRGGSDNLSVQNGLFGGDGPPPPPPPVAPDEVAGAEVPLECVPGAVVPNNDGHDDDPDIPGNLRIQASSGGDQVNINGRQGNLTIGKDLILNLSSGSNRANLSYIYVGDDLSIRASSGSDYVDLYNYWIHDRLDINLGSGSNQTYLGSGGNGGLASSAGRTTVRGSGGFDRVNTGGGAIDLGHNPQITTGGNEDGVFMNLVGWTGRFRVNTGSGDDNMWMNDCCSNGHELERGRLDVNTGSGDDQVNMQAQAFANDKFNGGPGSEDCIFIEDEDPTVVNFEFINDFQGCPQIQS